jgi:hypothetical protein
MEGDYVFFEHSNIVAYSCGCAGAYTVGVARPGKTRRNA